jgi:ribosomal protein S27E
MTIHSDLADGDRCKHCGHLLCEHFGGKQFRQTLRFCDDDLCDAIVVDITCANCGGINEIFWWAQIPTTPNMARMIAKQEWGDATPRRFAWAPAMKDPPVMITFRVTREQKAKLESLAKQCGCSVSDVIRAWIDGKKTEAIEKSINLRFKGKPPLGTEYHSGSGLDFRDGEEKEVPEAEAKRLLRDFSSFFECV